MYYPLKKNKFRKLGILIVLISLRQLQSGHFNVFYDFNAGDRPFYYSSIQVTLNDVKSLLTPMMRFAFVILVYHIYIVYTE